MRPPDVTSPQVKRVKVARHSDVRLQSVRIDGIRSYMPGKAQTIEFNTPLTLICGLNGAGKSVILESLRFATIGQFPPCNERRPYWARAFIHRTTNSTPPKTITGTVTLTLVDNQQRTLCVQRQLSMDTTTLKTKVAKGTVTLRHPSGSTVWKEGSRTLTAKALNAFMAEYMDVSPSVVTNVLFVHQKEAEWPLGNARELKNHIDLILGTERHTRANVYLNRTRQHYTKEYNVQQKNLEVLSRDIDAHTDLIAQRDTIAEGKATCEADMEEAKEKSDTLEAELAKVKRALKAAESQRQQELVWRRQQELKTTKLKTIETLRQEQARVNVAFKKADVAQADMEASLQRHKTTLDRYDKLSNALSQCEKVDALRLERKCVDLDIVHCERDLDAATRMLRLADVKQETLQVKQYQLTALHTLLEHNITTTASDDDDDHDDSMPPWITVSQYNVLVESVAARCKAAEKEATVCAREQTIRKEEQRQLKAKIQRLEGTCEEQCRQLSRVKETLKDDMSDTTDATQCRERHNEVKEKLLSCEESYMQTKWMKHAQSYVQENSTCPTCARHIDIVDDRAIYDHVMQQHHDDNNNNDESTLFRTLTTLKKIEVQLHESLDAHEQHGRLKKALKQKRTELAALANESTVVEKRSNVAAAQLSTLTQSLQNDNDAYQKLERFQSLLQHVHKLIPPPLNTDNDDDIEDALVVTRYFQHLTGHVLPKQIEHVDAALRVHREEHVTLTEKQNGLRRVLNKKQSRRERLLAKLEHLATLTTEITTTTTTQALKKDLEALRTTLPNLEQTRAQVSAKRQQVQDLRNEGVVLEKQLRGMGTSGAELREALMALDTHLSGVPTAVRAHRATVKQGDAFALDLKDQVKLYHEANGQYTNWCDRDMHVAELLQNERYFEVTRRHEELQCHVTTLGCVVSELDMYYRARDHMLIRYHQEKMAEVNGLLRDIWMDMYQGNDIDTITIVSECVMEKQKRIYNYQVMLVKQGVSFSMASHASRGQCVLACIVIRLAFARAFCLRTDMMVLDEPTTNLDAEHIRMLAKTLRQWMSRKRGTGFQLVVITHNRDFVQQLAQDQNVTSYYHIDKDMSMSSVVQRRPIEDVDMQLQNVI